MPVLTWPTKSLPAPMNCQLNLAQVVYPRGNGLQEQENLPGSMLVWGDNLEVMWSLLPEWEGKINLIYADPPFFTNRSFRARIGRGEDSRRPREWQMAEGYPDSWDSLDAYLNMLYHRLHLMYRLLSPTGTLYLHLDWHANAYARLLLDEIFGPDRFLNEIIWTYHGPSPIRKAFNRKHDTLLAYTKSRTYTFNADAVRTPYDPNTLRTFEASSKAGFGKIPDLERGKVPEDWWYFPVVARLHSERTGYPTQKPEGLLERIIRASSHPGDVVADFFCGSGTTPLVADRLGRRFIASDWTDRAIHTALRRLAANGERPFGVERVNQTPLPLLPAPSAWKARLETDQVQLVAEEHNLENLEYWEIGGQSEGVFYSIAQAVRTRRSHPLPLSLSIPSGAFSELQAQVLLTSGEWYQVKVEA